jgi:hypothetical protein
MLIKLNCFHEENKSTLNTENACYCVVLNLLSSHLLYNIVKIKIYNLLYRRAMWFLTFREEHRLRMSAKRVLRTTSGPKRMQERK